MSRWRLAVEVFITLEWIMRLGMIFVVPKGRRPSSATAWLMLIMIEPVVGSLTFFVFGTPRLPQYRRRLQKYADSHIAGELAGHKLELCHAQVDPRKLSGAHEQFIALNSKLGGLPVFGANNVDFLDDYTTALQSLAADIAKAKKRILCEYYIIAMDSTSEPVLSALESAAARGVEVYMLFDALACRQYPRFRQLKKRLSAAGIAWRPMLPISMRPGKKFTRPDLRNHRKIVVIDGRIGYTGSQNIIARNYHRRDELVYEELVVRVEGPIVWQLAAVFRTDWYTESGVFLPQDSPISSSGKVFAQVLPSGPSHGGSNNLKLYTALVHSAVKKIVIVTPYFVPDDALMTALTSAADRGVEVTIINSQIIDKLFVGHAQRSYYDELLQAGIKVYLYKSPTFLHTKHLTVDDDVAVVGSSNLDIRSFELDLEISLVLYDKNIVGKLRHLEKRYIAKSSRLNTHSWQSRKVYYKMIENVARLTAALQ